VNFEKTVLLFDVFDAFELDLDVRYACIRHERPPLVSPAARLDSPVISSTGAHVFLP
jgi:hypothetical protein